MNKENLTYSEVYVKKTNRIILAVGIASLLIFLVGIYLLLNSGEQTSEYTDPVFTDNDDALNFGDVSPLDNNIEFNNLDDAPLPITLTPNPIPLGQVLVGTSADNVLTIGTTGRAPITIISVELAEPPADGFKFQERCSRMELRGEKTCNVVIRWTPVVTGNMQNNFIVTWYETNLGEGNKKSEKVPVIGNAVTKEDCNFCETVDAPALEIPQAQPKTVGIAVGSDGKEIGTIDERGYVRDKNGNIIGRVNENGMVIDADGNVIGVGSNRKIVLDENGNVIGYVNPDGTVVDKDGNVIGKSQPDGTVVDTNGNILGKSVDTGFVYDEKGNVCPMYMSDFARELTICIFKRDTRLVPNKQSELVQMVKDVLASRNSVRCGAEIDDDYIIESTKDASFNLFLIDSSPETYKNILPQIDKTVFRNEKVLQKVFDEVLSSKFEKLNFIKSLPDEIKNGEICEKQVLAIKNSLKNYENNKV